MVTVGHNARVFVDIRDQQSEKKRRNGDRRAIWNATRGISAGSGVICHRGVSDGSDRARPLCRSHSARTEMFFADAVSPYTQPRSVKMYLKGVIECVWRCTSRQKSSELPDAFCGGDQVSGEIYVEDKIE